MVKKLQRTSAKSRAIQRPLTRAGKRRLVEVLLKTTSLSGAEIARRVGLSRQRVGKLKQEIMPGRETYFTRAKARGESAIALAKEDPTLSWREIRRKLGLSTRRNDRPIIVKKLGFVKEHSSVVRVQRERPLRRAWLDEKGIYYNPKFPITSPLFLLQRRFSNLRKRWKFRPLKYNPFLMISVSRINRNIAHLEECGIDWRDERLGNLVTSTPVRIDKQLAVLDSVNASSDLHCTLFKPLSRKAENYGKDYFASLRQAVVDRNVNVLLRFSGSIVKRNITLMQQAPYMGIYEIGKDALLDALSKCRHPEKNPAAFLAIASAAIDIALRQEAVRGARELSEASFYKKRRAQIGYY